MSIQERTYIMVKVSIRSSSSSRLLIFILSLPARRCPAWTRRQHHRPLRAAWLQARCLEARPRFARAPREASVTFAVSVHVQQAQSAPFADYADLKGKPFFPGLIKYMASGPVVAMVWEGLDAVKTGRVMLGATNPLASAPGTSPYRSHAFFMRTNARGTS